MTKMNPKPRRIGSMERDLEKSGVNSYQWMDIADYSRGGYPYMWVGVCSRRSHTPTLDKRFQYQP